MLKQFNLVAGQEVIIGSARYLYCMHCGNKEYAVVCDKCKPRVKELFDSLDAVKDRSSIQENWYRRFKRLLNKQEELDNG